MVKIMPSNVIDLANNTCTATWHLISLELASYHYTNCIVWISVATGSSPLILTQITLLPIDYSELDLEFLPAE